MIPDRFPDSLRGVIRQFPAGALQFEVGVQTFNDDVAALISRRQDNEKLEENLRFLRDETGVHVHADLIVGLPGESAESFAAGFDRLVALGPQEIQVGMLKRLRGTPIVRHDAAWQMVYSPARSVRGPFDPFDRRGRDGRSATVRPLLGSRRQQRQFRRVVAPLVGRAISVRRLFRVRRMVPRPPRAELGEFR